LLFAIFGVALFVWLAATSQKEANPPAVAYCCTTSQQNAASAPPADVSQNTPPPPASLAPPLPEAEADFISSVNAFRAQYENAANEFQKSTVRRERGNAIAEVVPSRSISGWVGTVAIMQTTSDGRGVLSIKLPSGTPLSIETMNNSLSDIGDNTLIPQGSSLYNEIANLSVGDHVTFSGVFAPSNIDYVQEVSLTEEGSMTDPDFIFTFASVSKQ
jgi:hypothetical protein